MSPPDYLLDLPADEAARLIALALLERSAVVARRLAEPTDAMALHDFRVAVRRLQYGVKVFRTELAGALPRRLRRRLRRLARLTENSRDLEVRLAWERAQRPALSEREQPGLGWHLERSEEQRSRADRRLRRFVTRRFEKLERRLLRRLQAYRRSIERDPSRHRLEAAAVLGARIRRFGGNLETRLATVRNSSDALPAHQARLAATRLRYLLEPIRDEVRGTEALIGKLRELEDVLAVIHESGTLRAELGRELRRAGREHGRRLQTAAWPGAAGASEADSEAGDPRPGLLALMRRLEEREAAAFVRLRPDWLSGAAIEFFDAVTAVGKTVAHHPACVAEIERRFLLRGVPATAAAFAVLELEQGWLPGTRVVERIRPLHRADFPTTYRTAKPAAAEAAPEHAELDQALFEEMWPLTAGRRIAKRRHVVSDYGLQWGIDQYLDRDLVLADVGIPGRDVSVVLPEWLQPYIIREVTGEGSYIGRALAR
ncbi:MAG TPA: CHAD domain-containing protein [Gemmatimonadales bacterium]|nr:CHAD domain-containing protein [Gemmatimonadales bacterium]